MKFLFRLFFALVLLGSAGAIGTVALVAGAYVYLQPALPETSDLADIRLQVPLSIYSSDGKLIAQIGTDRRNPVALEDIPEQLKQAFLAAEDARFYEHMGFDPRGTLRAILGYLTTGTTDAGGGSTITQQVARAFYLSPKESLDRKMREIFLSYRIEQQFPKDKILEIYLNLIFLGQRANGVSAAAQVYFGKNLDELTLSEMATLAGITNAPSSYNPVAGPQLALTRRNYVLGRMLEIGFIDRQAYDDAIQQPIVAQLHTPGTELDAAYVAEMVRQEMLARYGEQVTTQGFHVYTTIDSRLQVANDEALRASLLEYERRHGYRGAVERLGAAALNPPQGVSAEQRYIDLLINRRSYAGLWPALVLGTQGQEARVYVLGTGTITLPWSGLSWASRYVNAENPGPAPQTAADVLQAGDVVYVTRESNAWMLAQIPQVQGALVSMDPLSGAIRSLSGGYDYTLSTFNRVTQAQRQPGSSFKPFVFSAALEHGFTPASMVLDAPLVYANTDGTWWRPENYTLDWRGETSLREALARSLNSVAVRVLEATGVSNTIAHLRPFGFNDRALPRDFTMALGSGEVTPLEMTRGYAVFANGGYRVEPYLIERVEDGFGNVLYQAAPATVPCSYCDITPALASTNPPVTGSVPPINPAAIQTPAATTPPRVISATNAWIINDMMYSVIRPGYGGTGVRAQTELGRTDLAGKTGTSSEWRDAWFVGYNSHLVATAWMGFDQNGSLGSKETGGTAALPMWIDFMRVALDGTPVDMPVRPPGIVEARINPATGKLTAAGTANSRFEIFENGRLPPSESSSSDNTPTTTNPDPPGRIF